MTSPKDSSKRLRRNVQGHVVMADAAAMPHLLRLSTITLSYLFLQAKEYGLATLTIQDQAWTLARNPDHTFALSAGNPYRFSL